MKPNIAELEQRYQVILKDFQSGAIDEATFIAEADKLQFQDEWGRYWMIGAQSGAWHYFDGQTWHQADPNDADKLPVIDEEGRYWQRGAKSGEWYYYQPDTNEWIKPGQDEPAVPTAGQTEPVHHPAASHAQSAAHHYAPSSGTASAEQGEAQLYQDDEGRYWSVGNKTGQWYFYDDEGWHPAHEFETRVTARASQQQGYVPQPPAFINTAQPSYQPAPGPAHAYGPPAPHQPHQSQPPAIYAQPAPAPDPARTGAPAGSVDQPAPQSPPPAPPQTGDEAPAGEDIIPKPPSAAGQPGSWFYFDGKQWLQYSTDEPEKGTPPDSNLILDQETDKPQPKAEKKAESEPIVAEYIKEDEEPPLEVVDVEVITVYEAEPEPEPEPAPKPQPAPEPEPEPAPQRERSKPVPAPKTSLPAPSSAARTATSALSADEVVPRRSKDATDMEMVNRSSTPAERVPPRRTAGGSNRVVTPRGRRDAQPPAPKVSAPGGAVPAPPPPTARLNRASSPTKPIPAQQRRARENTLPMERTTAPAPKREQETPADQTRHRQATQSMPAASRAPSPTPAESKKTQVAEPPKPASPQPASQPAKKPSPDQEEKEGYTLGDVLRAFPSTVWTGVAGVAVLLIFAVIIIAGFMYGGNLFGTSNVAAVQSPTPTLLAGPPDSTPTPGPTPTSDASGPVGTPTKVTMSVFSSSDLDITLEHPENWELGDETNLAIFAPSSAGLDAESIEDVSMRIGISEEEDISISDLLTEVLAKFPSDLETLNEGTISIASQTWTSTQIRFEDEDLGGQGIATLAVTSKDGAGYYLMAVAPASDWNSVQPVFQEMINSFRFGAEAVIAQATSSPTRTSTRRTTRTPTADSTAAADEDSTPEAEEDDTEAEAEEEATPTPTTRPTRRPTPTPEASPTPLVYAIQPGDTLLEVATRFGVDLDLLTSENGISDPSSLQIGQELTIPFTAEQLAEYNASGRVASTGASSADDEDEDEDETDSGEDDEAAEETDDSGDSSDTDEAEEEEDAPATAANNQANEAEQATASEPQPVSGRIVYPAFDPGKGVYDIWMVDLATGEQTPIVSTASQPAFNKDGSLLAYRSWDRGTRGIFFRDFIGGRSDMVTNYGEDALPSWSPDGFSFAFASRKEGDRVPRVYIGNLQGDEAFFVGIQGEYVSTMPDGRLVAKGCTATGDCGMFIIGPRGGTPKKISGEPSDTAPKPSPDGSKIAFMSFGRAGNNWEVWTMNADGSDPVRLTENSSADGLPAWSPDGQTIAFVSNRGGSWAVWAMDRDGGNQRKLFDMKGAPDGKVIYDEFNSRGWLEERISWAP